MAYLTGHHRRLTPSVPLCGYTIEDCGYLTPCWVWQLGLDSSGYGLMGRGRAHLVLWTDANGPVPDGLELDHLCHNADATCAGGPSCQHRRCCNPGHLEPVTHAVNSQRGANAKLTIADVIAIRASNDVPEIELAARFGVGRRTINGIRRRESWANII
jgi:hypothetical protein